MTELRDKFILLYAKNKLQHQILSLKWENDKTIENFEIMHRKNFTRDVIPKIKDLCSMINNYICNPIIFCDMYYEESRIINKENRSEFINIVKTDPLGHVNNVLNSLNKPIKDQFYSRFEYLSEEHKKIIDEILTKFEKE